MPPVSTYPQAVAHSVADWKLIDSITCIDDVASRGEILRIESGGGICIALSWTSGSHSLF
jgi:hypothetical protein